MDLEEIGINNKHIYHNVVICFFFSSFFFNSHYSCIQVHLTASTSICKFPIPSRCINLAQKEVVAPTFAYIRVLMKILSVESHAPTRQDREREGENPNVCATRPARRTCGLSSRLTIQQSICNHSDIKQEVNLKWQLHYIQPPPPSPSWTSNM